MFKYTLPEEITVYSEPFGTLYDGIKWLRKNAVGDASFIAYFDGKVLTRASFVR